MFVYVRVHACVCACMHMSMCLAITELVVEGHTDIVKCVTGYDNKAYSAG